MKCKLVQSVSTHSREAGKDLTDIHTAGCTGNRAGLEPKDPGPKEEEFLGEKMQEQWLKRENARLPQVKGVTPHLQALPFLNQILDLRAHLVSSLQLLQRFKVQIPKPTKGYSRPACNSSHMG